MFVSHTRAYPAQDHFTSTTSNAVTVLTCGFAESLTRPGGTR